MKFKKLGFETKEGLSIANYQDGWSMEYGEGGSYTCDITYNGVNVAHIIEEGNGGPIMIDYYTKNHKAEDNKVLECLSRLDDDFKDLDKMPSYLKTNDVTYATLVNQLLAAQQKVKVANKMFKQGYVLVGIFDEGYQFSYIGNKVDNEQAILAHAKTQGLVKKSTKVSFFRASNVAQAI